MSKRGYVPTERTDVEKEATINDFRLARGLTLKELGQLADLRPSQITSLNSGSVSPIYNTGSRAGRIKGSVQRLCNALEVSPEQLFPRYLCNIQKSATTEEEAHEITQSAYSAYSTLNPEYMCEVNSVLQDFMSDIDIPWKHMLAYMLQHAYDYKTEEIGEVLGVTKQYVSILVAQATERVQAWVQHGTHSKSKRYLLPKGQI